MFKPTRKQLIGCVIVGLFYAFGTGNIVGCVVPTILIFLFTSWEIKLDAS